VLISALGIIGATQN